MPNHFSAANLRSRGDDRRLDLTDLFVFTSPATGPEFHPDAVYRISIDTNGDARADFADNNVDSIALEVSTDMLGAGPVIGVWATISLRRDGALVQVDRGGNPTIDPFINPDGEKDLCNSRQPADDIANYLGPWSAGLEYGGYAPEEAKAAAMQVLPDILRYDRSKPAAYPNGRGLTDDVFSMRFGWLTHGKVPPTGLRPHDDLLAQFPYLGPPNP